jgi:F0F1-type ATP synthase assembly protein I
MKPDHNPFSVYVLVAGVVSQVGCLLTLIAGGAVVIGALLDQALGTKPLFIFVFVLGSIPLSLWAVYRYTRYKTKSLQSLSPKEDAVRDD